MPSRNLLVLSLLVGLVAAVPTFAFDGDEHSRISDTGLRIAIKACEADPACGIDESMTRRLTPFLASNSMLFYGTLVRSVDYRLNPLQILQTSDLQETLPESGDALDEHLLRVLTEARLPFLRAASANDAHFQGELINGIRHWHTHAVNIAARDGNIFAALVLNSIADHYLQDFFAPGHVVTTRFGLHDAAALGMHNRYNSIGSTFVISKDDFERDLEPLLTFFEALDPESKLLAKAAELGQTAVPLWGDSDLWRSRQQELLMTLIEARSVLDILESVAQGKPVNSLRAVQWIPTSRIRLPGAPNRWRLAGARLPYGSYRHLQQDVRWFNPGSILGLSAGAHVLTGVGATRTRATYQFDFIVWGQPPIRAPRDRPSTEPVPAHFHDRSRSLRIGYVYELNEDEIARGPAVRAVWALPLIHSQLSGDLAWKTYLRQGFDSERRVAYGVRFQTGFSVLNLDLGIGRDYTFTPQNLEPALSMRFGATAAGPLSSIPVIGGIERGIFRWQRRRMERKPAAEAR